MRKIRAFCFCAAGAVWLNAVHADSIAWPSDFWTQVSNHVAAVASVPVASVAQSGFATFAVARDEVAGSLGTSARPFDSRLAARFVSDAHRVSSLPRMLCVSFR